MDNNRHSTITSLLACVCFVAWLSGCGGQCDAKYAEMQNDPLWTPSPNKCMLTCESAGDLTEGSYSCQGCGDGYFEVYTQDYTWVSKYGTIQSSKQDSCVPKSTVYPFNSDAACTSAVTEDAACMAAQLAKRWPGSVYSVVAADPPFFLQYVVQQTGGPNACNDPTFESTYGSLADYVQCEPCGPNDLTVPGVFQGASGQPDKPLCVKNSIPAYTEQQAGQFANRLSLAYPGVGFYTQGFGGLYSVSKDPNPQPCLTAVKPGPGTSEWISSCPACDISKAYSAKGKFTSDAAVCVQFEWPYGGSGFSGVTAEAQALAVLWPGHPMAVEQLADGSYFLSDGCFAGPSGCKCSDATYQPLSTAYGKEYMQGCPACSPTQFPVKGLFQDPSTEICVAESGYLTTYDAAIAAQGLANLTPGHAYFVKLEGGVYTVAEEEGFNPCAVTFFDHDNGSTDQKLYYSAAAACQSPCSAQQILLPADLPAWMPHICVSVVFPADIQGWTSAATLAKNLSVADHYENGEEMNGYLITPDPNTGAPIVSIDKSSGSPICTNPAFVAPKGLEFIDCPSCPANNYQYTFSNLIPTDLSDPNNGTINFGEVTICLNDKSKNDYSKQQAITYSDQLAFSHPGHLYSVVGPGPTGKYSILSPSTSPGGACADALYKPVPQDVHDSIVCGTSCDARIYNMFIDNATTPNCLTNPSTSSTCPTFPLSDLFVDLAAVYQIIGLGNINGAHIWPTPHQYIEFTTESWLRAPSAGWVTAITASRSLKTAMIDYKVQFIACDGYVIEFEHVPELSTNLQQAMTKGGNGSMGFLNDTCADGTKPVNSAAPAPCFVWRCEDTGPLSVTGTPSAEWCSDGVDGFLSYTRTLPYIALSAGNLIGKVGFHNKVDPCLDVCGSPPLTCGSTQAPVSSCGGKTRPPPHTPTLDVGVRDRRKSPDGSFTNWQPFWNAAATPVLAEDHFVACFLQGYPPALNAQLNSKHPSSNSDACGAFNFDVDTGTNLLTTSVKGRWYHNGGLWAELIDDNMDSSRQVIILNGVARKFVKQSVGALNSDFALLGPGAAGQLYCFDTVETGHILMRRGGTSVAPTLEIEYVQTQNPCVSPAFTSASKLLTRF